MVDASPKRRSDGESKVKPALWAAKFWARVDKSGTCWNWIGSKNPKGYGVVRKNGRMRTTHRISYEMFKGQITHGLFVCHSCDNPACVNPDHLWLGTNSDNIRDAVRKGRHVRPPHPGPPSHCSRGHEFTPSNTYMTSGHRSCVACRRMREKGLLPTKSAGHSVTAVTRRGSSLRDCAASASNHMRTAGE
jgi:hypothetical protein